MQVDRQTNRPHRALRQPLQTPAPDVRVERRANGELLLVTDRPLPPVARSFPQVFDATANRWPERPFMRQRDAATGAWEEITYGAAQRASRGLGQWLLDAGAGPGDAVAVLSGASIMHGIATVGIQRAGVPVAPIGVAYSLQAADHQKLIGCLQRAGVRFVLVDDADRFAAAIRAIAPLGLRIIAGRGQVPGVAITAFAEVIATVPTPALAAVTNALGPASIAKIMQTSGSTGTPKATPQLQANLTVTLAQCESVGLLDFGDDQPIFLEAMPYHHIMAGNFNYTNAIRVGGVIHIDEGKPMPELFGITIANLREVSPHMYLTVPAGFRMLCDALEADPGLRDKFFRNLVWLGFGGAVLGDAVQARLQALSRAALGFEVPIFSFYGATEYLFAALRYWQSAQTDVVGLPLPETELKLVPVGEKFALRVRSPTMMPRSGYLGDPKASAKLFDEEGFFDTGDMVRFLDPHHPAQGLVFDGRLAEEFKLGTGTWVSAGLLRDSLLGACPVLLDAVLCGQNQEQVGALLWLDQKHARMAAGVTGDGLPMPDLVNLPAVRTCLWDAVAGFNAANPGTSRKIAYALIIAEPLAKSAGELTDKGTANQRLVRANRHRDVDRLFDTADAEVLRW